MGLVLTIFLYIFNMNISRRTTGTKIWTGPVQGLIIVTRNDRDRDQSSGPEMTRTGTGPGTGPSPGTGPGPETFSAPRPTAPSPHLLIRTQVAPRFMLCCHCACVRTGKPVLYFWPIGAGQSSAPAELCQYIFYRTLVCLNLTLLW